ncbi:MAG: hypothetical protein HY961_21625 [Ignavibacteriae bacterium]|nr:hypothetical protein [Ignavibacteriota bacterium]
MDRRVFVVLSVLMLLGLSACDLGRAPEPDPQFLKLEFKYSFGNVVNTFDGKLTKDLVLDGSITIPFWFTSDEQNLIVAELNRAEFFQLPDTVRSQQGVRVEPNPGAQWLRVQLDQRQKSVVWFFPPEQTNGYGEAIQRLAAAIRSIVEGKREYKLLPAARGGYI